MPGNRGQAEEQGLERVEAHELVPVVGLDEQKDDRRYPQVGSAPAKLLCRPADCALVPVPAPPVAGRVAGLPQDGQNKAASPISLPQLSQNRAIESLHAYSCAVTLARSIVRGNACLRSGSGCARRALRS